MAAIGKIDMLKKLQSEVLLMQGFRAVNNFSLDDGLGLISDAFPNGSFPLGCTHEFVAARPEDIAATSGFISGLLALLMKDHGTVVWIGTTRKLFPPALASFGVLPDRFIFIDLQKEKDLLWATEEALKCEVLTAVVCETKEMSFTASRRLQLAAEQSRVTGFILRLQPRMLNTTACMSRWKITPLQSESPDDLPGVGSPAWRAELLRARNGKPAAWDIQWMDGRFVPVYKMTYVLEEQKKKAG